MEIFWEGKNFKIPSGIRTHDLQIHRETYKPLRYAVR